eukprot:16447276-Heterocapsa_arctica.AAC.1
MAFLAGQRLKNEEEERNFIRGTPASINRTDELAVLTARGLDRFDVQMCSGEVGRNLYKAIKKTAESSTALFKKLGWPTPVNNRQ